MEMAQLTRDKTHLRDAGWRTWQQTQQPLGFRNAALSHPRCRRGQSSSSSSCSSELRARQRSTSRTAALSSKASTNAGVKPPRPAHQLGQTCGATFGAKSMLGEVLATASPCARLRRTQLFAS